MTGAVDAGETVGIEGFEDGTYALSAIADGDEVTLVGDETRIDDWSPSQSTVVSTRSSVGFAIVTTLVSTLGRDLEGVVCRRLRRRGGPAGREQHDAPQSRQFRPGETPLRVRSRVS